MSNSDTVDTVSIQGDGSTKNVPREETKKEKRSRSRAWCFTLNNYTQEDIDFFTDTLDTEKYVFQEEIGEETGTPHLQGVVYFANARDFTSIRQLHLKCHWERCRDISKAVAYCQKQETRYGKVYAKGFKIKKELKIIKTLRPWQQSIIDELNTEPDDRKVHWFWEETGNVGKTAIVKYILTKYDNALVCTGGDANSIAYQILKYKDDPDIFIFAYPREKEEKVSFNAIEQVKDGLTFSSKYEGGFKLFNPPHVLIFANWPPDLSKLSKDRWLVTHIENMTS